MRVETVVPGKAVPVFLRTCGLTLTTLLLGLALGGCDTGDQSPKDVGADTPYSDIYQAADHFGQDGVYPDGSSGNPDLPEADIPFNDSDPGFDFVFEDDQVNDSNDDPLGDWIPVDYVVNPDALELTIANSGGFDDFSSPGAALGYAVDVEAGWLLVIAMRFELPTAFEVFDLTADPVVAAAGYPVKDAVQDLELDGQHYPLLKKVWTDTAGIRTMASEATLLLVKEDAQSATGIRIWVAGQGQLTLRRLDGPKDIVTGLSVLLQEVTLLGPEAQLAPEATQIELAPFYFEWSTAP